MKKVAKLALGALLMAGTAFAVAAPASAGVSVGFGIGFGPGYYGPPAYATCDPYSRYYDPYNCGYYSDYYGPPIFIDGSWFNGGRYRDYDGHREYWMHNRWYRGDGRYGDRDGWHGGGDFRGRGGWNGGGGWHGDGGWRGDGGFHGGGHRR